MCYYLFNCVSTVMGRSRQGYHLAKMHAEAGAAPSSHPAYLSDLTRVLNPSGASTTMERSVQPGTYAIVCLRRYREANMEMRPFALAGPIEVSE
jgi:hypothetical protein